MDSSTSHPASPERRRNLALWIGLLAGPIVWLALLQTNYVLAYVACETRATWFMHLATAVAVVLVAGAGLGAWRASDSPVADEEAPTHPLSGHTPRQRARWMGLSAVVFSVWFIVVILAMEIPILVLKECQ